MLLVTAALVRNIPVLIGIYASTVVLAAASRLPVGFFVKRVWLFIPIFTGIIVIPATLNVITPGTIVLPLWNWFGHAVGITEQGLTTAGLLVMRVACSISIVVLLTLTTTVDEVAGGAPSALRPEDLHPGARHGVPVHLPAAELGDRHVHGSESADGRQPRVE